MISHVQEAPVEECECDRIGSPPCDYCQAMTLWAHEVLYGRDDDDDPLEQEDVWDDEEEEARCACKLCFCYNMTPWLVCENCSSGAHQG